MAELGDVRLQRVLATVDSIPPGRVATYGGVAALAGLPRLSRYVGRVLRELPPGTDIPWHRVVAAGGVLRTAGTEQARRLRAEGVGVTGGRVALELHLWP